MTEARDWKATLHRNALWVSLGALALAVAVVAVGVQVAPETFYDRFVWEDIYGPLVVDAHQCRSSLDPNCRDLGPHGIPAKDGYTITSELTYGVVLAVLLYGIYVGLFRRYGIVADGWFVLGLLPWILLGPLARALEDANVFCAPGTDCAPNAFAYVFISPVIYIHIALYVIAFMLLGVHLQRRRDADPRLLTGIVAAVLAMGFAAFAFVSLEYGHTFGALPPLWFVALSCLAAGALFHHRARRGLASVNLTLFALGLPYALGCVWLIGRWLSGDVWSEAAWHGRFFLAAGAFIFLVAVAVALAVALLSRTLARPGIVAAWSGLAGRVPKNTEKALGWAGGAAVVLAALMAGVLPNVTAFFDAVPNQETLIPVLGLGGLALLAVFSFLHVGREAGARPGVLLIYGLGINLALVLGHMIDGTATWVALNDPVGFGIPQYSEKHPFSDFLLRYWDGFLFPFAKLLMVLVVVWLMDREFQQARPGEHAGEDARAFDERNLVGLVKMAIFVLGFAPGLRDLLRLAMAV